MYLKIMLIPYELFIYLLVIQLFINANALNCKLFCTNTHKSCGCGGFGACEGYVSKYVCVFEQFCNFRNSNRV